MPMVFKTGVILFDKKPSTRYFGKHKNMDNQLYYITVYIGFIESYIQYSGGMPAISSNTVPVIRASLAVAGYTKTFA